MTGRADDPLAKPANPGKEGTSGPTPRSAPTVWQLRELADSREYREAAALLDGVDLNAELGADFDYYAGVCLGWTGCEERAVELLKRAAAAGADRFWCACHLGWFEANRGAAVKAACYFTAALIRKPDQTWLDQSLDQAAPDIDRRSLQVAQARVRSTSATRGAFDLGTAALAVGKPSAAAHYFTTALALDLDHAQSRSLLLLLAPDIPLELIARSSIDLPTLRQLYDLANSRKYGEAAALLDGVDSDAKIGAQFAYYAGVCLGWAGHKQRAVDLLKRAAIQGANRFWCACHLGWFEADRNRTAHAACYFSVALSLQPNQTHLYPSLEQIAPGLDLRSLQAAQAAIHSADAAREASELGAAKQAAGDAAAAAHYFTTALALDIEDRGARERLLELAPDISLAVLYGVDPNLGALEVVRDLERPVSDIAQFEGKVWLVVHSLDALMYYEAVIPTIERLFCGALAIPGVGLDSLCRLYDIIYSLYWQTSSDTEDMRGFGDRVAAPFAAAIREGIACDDLPLVVERRVRHEPLRLGYLSESANSGAGNAVGPFIHHILGGLSRHFPGKYRLVLYAWRGDDDDFLASLAGGDIIIRRFDAPRTSDRIAAVANAIAKDEIDILITDVNAALPTVLFERRVAPVQIFYQFGLPFWPLANVDAVFRLEDYDPRRDGFDPAKCFTTGLGPWDMTVLAPPVDPTRVAVERALFPQNTRLIGTYGRLTKITPGFLAIVGDILTRLPQVMVVLGGTGDGGRIRDFIAANGLRGRLIVVERLVDGHLWGHMLDVFLDTSPQEGGVACREMMAKGRPVVTLRSVWAEQERVPMLVADDPKSYVEIVSRLIENGDFYDRACAATRDFVASRPRESDYAVAIHQAITTVTERVRAQSPSVLGRDRNVVLEGLVCRSVLDELRHSAPSRIQQVDFGPGENPIEVGAVDELLYLPALHLQVWRGHIVPHEANFDGDAFPELQKNIRSGTAILAGPLADVEDFDDDVCVLSNLYSNNFFHCFEELNKVTILERNGFRGRYVLSPYGDRHYPGLPPYATEFLELLGIRDDRIVICHKPTLFRSAWFTTRFACEETIAYSNVFFALRAALIAAATTIAPGLGPRLYLERYPKRVIVNREEVRECVSRYGFVTVDMATLSVAQQIAAAHQAEVLLGTHGSGMLHCAFLKAKSTVIECFSPHFMDFFILDYCHLLEHRYFQIVAINRAEGPLAYKYGGDVAINCHHLELVLKSVCGRVRRQIQPQMPAAWFVR